MEVGTRELRDHLSRYLDLVSAGAHLTVTNRGRAVARLAPPDRPRRLNVLVAEGLITPAATPKRVRVTRPIVAQGTVSDLLGDW